MAYNDTLFQLGMDLTRSSTAQKEDHTHVASVAEHTVRGSTGPVKEGVRHAGFHIIIDLYGAERLDDVAHIEQTLKRCADVSGAHLAHVHLLRASDGDVSGAAVLDDGHISVQARSEAAFAAFDVFMDGDARPQRCVEVLREAFAARDVAVKILERGRAPVTAEFRSVSAQPRLRSVKGGRKAKAA